MLINAHDHFYFYKDLESGLNTIEKNKIITLVNSMTFEEYLELKNKYSKNPLIKIGLGIHPWKVDINTNLSNLIEEIKSCDFIGEIGLDFHWDKRTKMYSKQKIIFNEFLFLADSNKKVVNIHTKGAEREVLNYLKQHDLKTPIIHWYSGDLSLIDEYLSIGAYFTIGPDAGYSKTTDEIINILPINRILTETDGPTSIEWINGSYSESDYIKKILEYISNIKKISLSELEKQIYKNYLSLNIK